MNAPTEGTTLDRSGQFTQRWGRTWFRVREASGQYGVHARGFGGEDVRAGFVQHHADGWSWACTLDETTTFSVRRFSTVSDASRALVESRRIKVRFDR